MATKDDVKRVSEKAKGYFEQGFNWAESISLSFKEYFGIQDSIIPRLATGYGGGIGRKGSLCGAFTGSIMAIGMKLGRTDPKDRETVSKIYEKCQQFWYQFEKEFGSTLCYNIIGVHLDNEEERQKWLASGGMEKCAKIVEKTAQMLCDFVNEMKWWCGMPQLWERVVDPAGILPKLYKADRWRPYGQHSLSTKSAF